MKVETLAFHSLIGHRRRGIRVRHSSSRTGLFCAFPYPPARSRYGCDSFRVPAAQSAGQVLEPTSPNLRSDHHRNGW